MKRRILPCRRGITLDYLMVFGVVVPASAVLFFILVRSLRAFYYFSSILLNWLPF